MVKTWTFKGAVLASALVVLVALILAVAAHFGFVDYDKEELAVEEKPNDVVYSAEALYEWGNVLSATGKTGEAIDKYTQSLMLDSSQERAHCNLGSSYMLVGEIVRAIEHYEKAIALKPDYVLAHLNMGRALFRVGQPDKGAHHLRRAHAFAEAAGDDIGAARARELLEQFKDRSSYH